MVNKKKRIKKTPYEIRQNVAYFVKNRLPAFILAGLIIFWTIASIFGLIGYCRSKPKNTAMVTANAMTVEDYVQGREIIIDLTYLYDPVFYDGDYYFLKFYPRLVLGDGYSAIAISNSYNSIGQYYEFNTDITIESLFDPFGDYDIGTDMIRISTSADTTANFIDNYSRLEVEYVLNYGQGFEGEIKIYAEYAEMEPFILFNFSFAFLNSDLYDALFLPMVNDTIDRDSGVTLFRHQAFGFPIVDFINLYEEYVLHLRDYDRGYNAGYENGLKAPNQAQFNEGYEQGKNDGWNNGYARGKADGLALADVATFEDLMSSVFDVPIRAFTSLFNFDILGVNMATFFLSILTLCIVLAVVKMLI